MIRKDPPLDQTGGLRDEEKEGSMHHPALYLNQLPGVQAGLLQGLNLDSCLPVSLLLQRNLCRLPVRWRNPHIRCLKQNITLPAIQGNAQSWISTLAKQTDDRSSFNKLLHTPIDFSNFIMNQLGVDTLTSELLAGPTYELMRGSCNSLTELEYHLEEVYKAITDQLDWVNPEGQQYRHNLLQPLPLIPDNQGRRVIPKLFNLTIEERFAYNVSLRMFTRSIVIQRRMEDLQLGFKSYQKRLNLIKPDTYRSDLKRREAFTAYSYPRGFSYQNKDKKNRLMRIDELYKFSDETLNDVRNALDDRLKGIRIQYVPTTIWRNGDKDRAAAMIQAIDKMLKTRRIMRSLERFVGGRQYEGDFRMLQRTI
nr:hypothetical protein [Tanacetum cinerariifolium]